MDALNFSKMMTEKYTRFNLRKLKDDFPSIADKIDARLTPPADDTYFTNLLGGYFLGFKQNIVLIFIKWIVSV